LATVLGSLQTPALLSGQQSTVVQDTLFLGVLQADAVRRDPRGRQVELLASQSALRLRNLQAERLPTLSVLGQTQYQSDVPVMPLEFPGGLRPPIPPKDTYDAYLSGRARLYDPTVSPRRAAERAQLAESQARVHTALYDLRRSVNEAYFGALLLGAQRAELENAVTNLEAQRKVAAERVQGGAALRSEVTMLDAELLRRRQTLADLAASREATLDVLEELTGQTLDGRVVLALPDLSVEVARARAALSELRARPEYEQFARSREVIERQQAVIRAQDLPRVSAYSRAGYGQPGLNPLGTGFDTYWLGGVQVEWMPWRWGTTEREREVLALQQQIVASEEAAFTDAIRRSVIRDLATIDRLEQSLQADAAIIALREQVLRETRLRFNEGVVTSAEYVDRETDLLDARLARVTHSVELAQARARFLTQLGLEVR
jgi:outer membrane protein TolC